MYKFSKISEERLGTCHDDIQRVVKSFMAKQVMDFSVLCGYRGEDDQDKAFRDGHSKLKWPQSHHNVWRSLAVDLAAYPIDGFDDDNTRRTCMLAGWICAEARGMGIPLFWGGMWDKFPDIYHFQLPRNYRVKSK